MLATRPTELVVTNGAPQMKPVGGGGLLTMANADHAVLVDPASNDYYVLVSGRWFRATMLPGPWQYVPGSELPADFAKISPSDPKANVLVSVPGTPQAKEAAIAATIPQTATVSRAKAVLTVAYDGAPRFVPITGTSLSYAANTGTPVIEVDSSHYYAVANGVWFTAPTPTGAWHVATEVPSAIYTIPPSSPVYYVTYVRIYSVTPDTVVVGYTPGYMGVVVSADGTVVYGTGYVYPAYVGAVYYGYPVTYGYGAGFGIGLAEGFAFALLPAPSGARHRRTGDLLVGRPLQLELREREPGQLLRSLGPGHGHACAGLECLDRYRVARYRGVRIQPGHGRTFPGQPWGGVQSVFGQFRGGAARVVRQSVHGA